MSLQKHLIEQMALHPAMEPQDIVKLCYQTVFGPAHMLNDVDQAKAYFDAEYESVSLCNLPLYEVISDRYCRINLGSWKKLGYSKDILWYLFEQTGAEAQGKGTDEELLQTFDEAQSAITDLDMSEDFKTYLSMYISEGIHAVHHSKNYAAQEDPHYRVISIKLLKENHTINH